MRKLIALMLAAVMMMTVLSGCNILEMGKAPTLPKLGYDESTLTGKVEFVNGRTCRISVLEGDSHYDAAKCFMEHGIHVICDKPLALNVEQAEELKALAEEKMRLLDIEKIRKQSYRTLSGGQQQRVLLARALCATDSILLLDEPVTGLDPEATEELYGIIRRLNREHGVAVVMVSHDLHGSMRDAGKVLVMNHGVDFLGTVHDYEAKFERRVNG